MDLEQTRSWLSLAQQPYPLISAFLKQLDVASVKENAASLIDYWLTKNNCTIDQSSLNKSLHWLELPGHHLTHYLQYPEQLKAITSPPPLLFLAGNPRLLFTPQIAIVGSRKPTAGGRENCLYFAHHLAESGLTIISGLAMGIDGLAHQAAMDGDGQTIAVLGCGHNTCYPDRHRQLFQQIKQQGLLISEFTPDTEVRAHQFPRRNRIISGLSIGVLVIEAAIKSGSLITCRLAAEQGREVFAIPGDITNPMSRGCHHLIRHGACLVESPEQILQELNFDYVQPITSEQDIANNELSSVERKLMQCINRHPTTIDDIVNRSEMKMKQALSLLFKLELKNRIVATAEGYFRCHSK